MIARITPIELQSLLENGERLTLLDCREPDEFEIAALPGAKLIPLANIARDVVAQVRNKDARIVVYCHHGMRSLRAATLLAGMGYSNVANLSGGIDSWSTQVDPAVPRY
jgi:adenylyltransferase/sulfurtransferase